MFFLLEETPVMQTWPTLLIMVGIMVVVMIFSSRSQKKQEREANEMRNNLRVGDEVTTIGGIVGKIVSLREETVVIETTKDKTHIRFLRQAIRSVDVCAEDSAAAAPAAPAAPAEEAPKAPKAPKKKGGKKKGAAPASETPVEAPAVEETPAEEAPATEE